MLRLLKRAFDDWMDDECPRMAAAMSYYAVFSLPPLLLVVLMVTGLFVDPEDISGRIQAEIAAFIGNDGAEQIREMIRNVDQPGTGGPLVATLSVLGLLFGATGAFGQLQSALNRAWEVRPDPQKGGVLAMVGKRVLSLGMVLTLSLLLLVSLVVSAALAAVGDGLGRVVGDGVPSAVLLQIVNAALSLGVSTVLFAAIFRFLPDARVAWRDVAVGALGTAILFEVGKFSMGFYFARANPGEAFGAAGSLALIMLWVYYSALIVFYGAEFTQVWATERGAGVHPEEGAVRVREEPSTPR